MTAQFEQPLVSIDVVPIRFDGEKVQVALAGRQNEPFKDYLALPGVLLGAHETIREAALRALRTKAGIGETAVRHLMQFGAFDNSDRDPRGPTISIAFFAIILPGVEFDAAWGEWDAEEAEGSLPFDHEAIINAALAAVNLQLWKNEAVTRALLGETFTTTSAIALTEALAAQDEIVDRTNFTRTLKSYPGIVTTGTVKGKKGRPTTAWAYTA